MIRDKRLPLISIVTPTYNQSKYLEETIQSVLLQDYPNIEYIVLNDGSTDNTEEILKKYDGKIIWESHQNIGQTPTINKGWRLSNGQIIAYINSDDTYVVPGAVSKGVEFLLANLDIAMVYGDAYEIDEVGRIVKYHSAPKCDFTTLVKEWARTLSWQIVQPSTFIRREILDEVGYLDPSIYYAMDLDYWLRIGIKHKIAHLSEPLSCYRLHSESKTMSTHARNAPDFITIFNKFFDRTDLPKDLRALRRRVRSSAYLRTAKAYHAALDYQQSRHYILKGFSHYPLNINWIWIKRLLVTLIKQAKVSSVSD